MYAIRDAFRLADPFICLPCGAASPAGIHNCGSCHLSTWGDRFTRSVSETERTQVLAEMASTLGFTFGHAERQTELMGHEWGDYSEHVRHFYKALDHLFNWLREGRHLEHDDTKCAECRGDYPPPVFGTRSEAYLWAHGLSCPPYRLHVAKLYVGYHEALRYGLPEEAVIVEVVRRAKETQRKRKAEELQNFSLAAIVNQKVERP